MKELSKAYEPGEHEQGIYKKWEDSGFFNPDVCIEKGIAKSDAPVFSMVLPPPNVTGTLHIGHATRITVEDILVRFHRMQGDRTLWIPGTDHAGIATQSKVEKILLKEEGKTRFDVGREDFLARVNAFAADSHDTIVGQCKSMGASLDWSRECYTFDETRNKIVREVFARMYNDGIIYRGHRVINWDPVGKTVISDDEVVHKEVTAKLYTFKYSHDFPIPIATTRPETKVGDTGVAVNPKGKWKEYIGQTFENIDFAGAVLAITIVGDESVDEEFGTGALGVTPAHSTIDAEIAQRNNLPMIQVIDEDACMTAQAGVLLQGKPVKEGREIVVAWLRDQKLMISEDETTQNLSLAERTDGVIEPLPKLQWFVAVNKEFDHFGKKTTLKKLMQAAVREQGVEFIPERFENTYFHWIDNLRDWCISRQLWFGHRIPVWYRGEEIFCGVDAPTGEGWMQDEDTLDTWFSSGSWTFSTLGWPEETTDFKTYHPISVLETAYDILFFWVARMILMSTYTLNEIPFKQVYLLGLVRDGEGRKMSKSLGNMIVPATFIEQFGTDATRLSLVLGTTPGNDVKLSEEKVAGLRNFTNKLWNMSRFMLSKIDAPVANPSIPEPKTVADQWILSRLHGEVIPEVTRRITEYDLSGAGEILREFTWNEVADWYVEIAKIEGDKSEMLNYLLQTLLTLWHPFMPYVTEYLYGAMHENEMLMVTKWPTVESSLKNDHVEKELGHIQEIVAYIRNQRAENNVDAKEKVAVHISTATHIENFTKVIATLTQASEVVVTVATGADEISIKTTIDPVKERVRLEKEIASVAPYIESLKKKLGNETFVSKAPPAVIDQEKEKLREAEEKLASLSKALNNL